MTRPYTAHPIWSELLDYAEQHTSTKYKSMGGFPTPTVDDKPKQIRTFIPFPLWLDLHESRHRSHDRTLEKHIETLLREAITARKKHQKSISPPPP